MAPNRTPSESVCRKSSKLQGIVEHDPVAALRLNEQVGLVGFAVLGTPGDPEQALRLLELRQPVADLAAIGLQLALVGRDSLRLHHLLEDEDVLPCGRTPIARRDISSSASKTATSTWSSRWARCGTPTRRFSPGRS